LRNSRFENLIGYTDSSNAGGGALMISESINSKADGNRIIIENTVFLGCSNTNGGALGLTDTGNVKIFGNTQFINNKASKAGGAINFKCSDYGYDLEKCKLTIKDTLFSGNKAGEEGGSIKWNFYEPLLSGITFSNNSAGIYG
jgi:predicted outer membrane repeat protein